MLATGDATKFKLRDEAFLAEHDIDVKLGKRADAVDTTKKTITLDDGTVLVSLE